MDSFKELSLHEYTQALSGKDAVPGGGGTAALTAALAISLGNMVASLTVGKKKYAAVEQDMQDLKAKGEALREEFLLMIDQDAAAFSPLAKAYSLPKETKEQREYRDVIMEEALRQAALAPMEVMRRGTEVVALLEEAAAKGSRLAVSDAGCGAALIAAAVKSAALNVLINTKMMKDRDLARELNSELLDIVEEYTKRAEKIYQDVYEELIIQ